MNEGRSRRGERERAESHRSGLWEPEGRPCFSYLAEVAAEVATEVAAGGPIASGGHIQNGATQNARHSASDRELLDREYWVARGRLKSQSVSK